VTTSHGNVRRHRKPAQVYIVRALCKGLGPQAGRSWRARSDKRAYRTLPAVYDDPPKLGRAEPGEQRPSQGPGSQKAGSSSTTGAAPAGAEDPEGG